MEDRQPLGIVLSPELEAFINESVASGGYSGADDVISAALRAMKASAARPADEWLIGGGICGKLIREKDWSQTALGPSDTWSLTLRTTVANVANSPVAKVLMWGPDHVMIYNDPYIDIAGANHPAALGGTVPGIWPEIWDWNREMLEAGFRGELRSYRNQPLVLVRNGVSKTFIFDLFYTPVYEEDGSVGGVLCTVVDNSDRAEMEKRLAASEAELRHVTDAVPMLISYVDRDHIYRFANATYAEWFGVDLENVIGRHVRDTIGETVYANRRSAIDRALAGESFTDEANLGVRSGKPLRLEIRYIPRVEPDGSIPGVYILGIDIGERADREAELAASNSRFRAAMQAIHGVLWTNSADGRMLGDQAGWVALTGQNEEQYSGYGWANVIHPEDRAGTVEAWQRSVATKSIFVYEHRVCRHDGEWRRFAVRALPIIGPDGDILEWVGVHTDITHQRAAEEALRQLNETLEARVIAEIEERRQAEAKLAQAQKMETIGKLTGGVAHDFNNILQVVSGNLQLLARDAAGNERAETRIANALAGVARGSKLASQLLAFGRRQALEPKVVNISRFVRDMDDMIRRAIGEAIEVETVVGGGLWNTFIDPNQIENALLNLAINARDAMDGQGKLTIELANARLDDHYSLGHDEVTPGQYVMMAVTDTGCGMPPEIIDKVFEPFFSTKAEGKGSGLGLSMVYGFVKQSGGHVKIYSEVGQGTTIKLYLPRAYESEDVAVVTNNGSVTGGSETVLVVEDDPPVRETVVAMLADLGYRVLQAVDAASALIVIESGIPIDLLFTDVVMPGKLKSPEMARKAKERLPNLAVLFTSGYTENSIVHGGRLDPGVELLSKPYTREALARKIRHVLANTAQRTATARPATTKALQQPNRQPQPTSMEPPPTAEAPARFTVLLVEDDGLIRMSTADAFQEAGFQVMEAADGQEAVTVLESTDVDALVTDVNLPRMSGRELAARCRTMRPDALVVFTTGDPGSVSDESNALVFSKPYDPDRLAKEIHLRCVGRQTSA
ncbi:PAS domain-containing protein [Ciceribacter sp. L1K22]|nr:PAS domain-containing protein [Ciceribacter sp. L1K22]